MNVGADVRSKTALLLGGLSLILLALISYDAYWAISDRTIHLSERLFAWSPFPVAGGGMASGCAKWGLTAWRWPGTATGRS